MAASIVSTNVVGKSDTGRECFRRSILEVKPD